MGQKSSIDKLPKRLRDALHAALKAGHTYDEIVQSLTDQGANISRSAVGRYSKNFRELAARQRELSAVAASFADEFGSADNRQTRLLIQMFTSMMTQAAIPLASGEDVALDPKAMADFARAIKDIATARKTDVDTERAIRADERAIAASEAVSAAKTAGASDETIDAIKKKLLGIDG